MNPLTITSDLEPGFLSQLQLNFPKAVYILCWFHIKQRWRKKLKDLHVSSLLISKLLGIDGFINTLALIPISEIAGKGIAYVRAKMAEEEGNRSIWDDFWGYFRRNYLSGLYGPKYWNIPYIRAFGNEDENLVLINRTNNPLERYNRRFLTS